jgi:hypothetical protein
MNCVLVDIGITTSYDFFFEVAWPNYREVGRNPSPISALNAAWSFWHLHEWYYWEHCSSASEEGRERYVHKVLLPDCPELCWLRDIAEAGKHFKLREKKKHPIRVRAISTREEFNGALGSAPLGTVPIGAGSGPELFVDVDGRTCKLQQAMGAAFTYWLGKVLPHQVVIRFSPDDLPQRSERMLDWCRARMGDESVSKWRWTLLQGANAPDYVQRLNFLEADDADAFRRDFQVPIAAPADTNAAASCCSWSGHSDPAAVRLSEVS